MTTYTGARIITTLLERQGIGCLAGIPGGANLPLYDALRASSITHVLARHEQGAGFIAQGMARATGQTAVFFATSGPGATNALTAIADAKMDSVPLVVITGQVPSSLIGTDAFQEIDMYGLTIPITKHNFLAGSPRELLHIIPESFRLAASGRPGPVVVDVPKDVQNAATAVEQWPEPAAADAPPLPDSAALEQAAALLRASRQPVIFIGGGVLSPSAGALIETLARRLAAPVVSTLMGLGVVAADQDYFHGMVGMHGWRYVNRLLQQADLVMGLGVRFDDRATGKIDAFCPRARVIHVDIDASEFGKVMAADVALCCDSVAFLRDILPLLTQTSVDPRWSEQAQRDKAAMQARPADSQAAAIIGCLGRLLPPEAIVTSDVGQHQMWVAQYYPFRRPRTWLTSGGLGTMGFGLPAAIGAALARPGTPVVCVSGDGSLLMNVQELVTLAELQADVKIVLLNNRQLGLVRQQQELFYEKQYMASEFAHTPDFVKLARACGVNACRLSLSEDWPSALRRRLRKPGPLLIEIPISGRDNVLPMVIPGKGNDQAIGGEYEQ